MHRIQKFLQGMHLREGKTSTPLDGLELYKLSQPFARLNTVYPSSICFIVQGQKSLYLGEERIDYQEGEMLLSSVPMPVQSELREASSESPYFGVILHIDARCISELLLELNHDLAWIEKDRIKLMEKASVNASIELALLKLLQTLEDPRDRKILEEAHLRELYYRILCSPIGYLLRNSAIQHSKAHQIATVIQYIEEHFHESISIRELSQRAGMSESRLYSVFKETTALSPLQFIKKLRLHNAYNLLRLGENASDSAYASGYSSATQFSREFKREYGVSPSKIRLFF